MIMNYEQKYKETLERAKTLYENANGLIKKRWLEQVFPELKESEDERIRKELIEFVKSRGGFKQEYIAWLEKQGEQKPDDMIESKFMVGDWVIYKNDICQIVKREEGCNKLVTTFGIEKELVNERNLSTARLWTINDAKDGDVLVYSNSSTEIILLFKKWINGVGEGAYSYAHTFDNRILFNNWSDCGYATTPATKEQRELLFQKMKEAGYEWDSEKKELRKIEKQYEQKPIDKVEPKFKAGDWVIDKQGIVHQIANVIENVTYHTYGYDIVGGGYFNDNTEGVRLWTIQDAKDGDVLDANGAPFIYKKHDKDYVYFYCGINLAGEFIEANEFDTWNNNNNKIYPVTKEQRDLLFQKMKEAGYEWDSEKKELNKIETPSNSWTDEDDKILIDCCNVIHRSDYCKETILKIVNWIKSLKERMQ